MYDYHEGRQYRDQPGEVTQLSKDFLSDRTTTSLMPGHAPCELRTVLHCTHHIILQANLLFDCQFERP